MLSDEYITDRAITLLRNIRLYGSMDTDNVTAFNNEYIGKAHAWVEYNYPGAYSMYIIIDSHLPDPCASVELFVDYNTQRTSGRLSRYMDCYAGWERQLLCEAINYMAYLFS